MPKKRCNKCSYLQNRYSHHPHAGISWLECELSCKTLFDGYIDKRDFKGVCCYSSTEIKNLKCIKKQHEKREEQERKKEIYENE